MLDLASGLETHELLDCRRIAALLYRKNKKYNKSIEMSKNSRVFVDTLSQEKRIDQPNLRHTEENFHQPL